MAYSIFPLELVILPQSSEFEACADSYLFQESSCLVSVTNLWLEVRKDIKTHFKDVNTHSFTHGIICKDNIFAHIFPTSHLSQGLQQ